MSNTQYVYTYEQADKLFASASDKKKGKPLGTSWYRLTYGSSEDKYYIHYGNWGTKTPTEENRIYSISKENIITNLIDFDYDKSQANTLNRNSQLKQMDRGWVYIRPNHKATLSMPGYWHDNQHPIFMGFKMQRTAVLTPLVIDIEKHMDELKAQCAKKAKELSKIMKIYAKFDAFTDAITQIRQLPETKSIALMRAFRASQTFLTIDKDDMQSLIKLVGLRSAFGVYESTFAGAHYEYNGGTGYYKQDFNIVIPAVIKHSILRYLASTRNDLYKAWYNEGHFQGNLI